MQPTRRRGRLGRAILVASIAVIVTGFGGGRAASYASVTAAGFSDISGAALRTSDAPKGYTLRDVKLFSTYQRNMRPPEASTTCAAPKGVTRRTWKQGLVAALDNPSKDGIVRHRIDQCIYLLTSISAAHSVYLQLLPRQLPQGVKSLSLTRVGDEETAVSESSSDTASYVVLVRHRNALMRISYDGTANPQLSVPAFGKLVVNVDSRLK